MSILQGKRSRVVKGSIAVAIALIIGTSLPLSQSAEAQDGIRVLSDVASLRDSIISSDQNVFRIVEIADDAKEEAYLGYLIGDKEPFRKALADERLDDLDLTNSMTEEIDKMFRLGLVHSDGHEDKEYPLHYSLNALSGEISEEQANDDVSPFGRELVEGYYVASENGRYILPEQISASHTKASMAGSMELIRAVLVEVGASAMIELPEAVTNYSSIEWNVAGDLSAFRYDTSAANDQRSISVNADDVGIIDVSALVTYNDGPSERFHALVQAGELSGTHLSMEDVSLGVGDTANLTAEYIDENNLGQIISDYTFSVDDPSVAMLLNAEGAEVASGTFVGNTTGIIAKGEGSTRITVSATVDIDGIEVERTAWCTVTVSPYGFQIESDRINTESKKLELTTPGVENAVTYADLIAVFPDSSVAQQVDEILRNSNGRIYWEVTGESAEGVISLLNDQRDNRLVSVSAWKPGEATIRASFYINKELKFFRTLDVVVTGDGSSDAGASDSSGQGSSVLVVDEETQNKIQELSGLVEESKAKEKSRSYYTEGSYQKLVDAVAAAEALLNNVTSYSPEAYKAELDLAILNINSVGLEIAPGSRYGKYDPRLDDEANGMVSELESMIENAKALDRSLLSTDQVVKLEEAIKEAEDDLNEKEDSPEEYKEELREGKRKLENALKAIGVNGNARNTSVTDRLFSVLSVTAYASDTVTVIDDTSATSIQNLAPESGSSSTSGSLPDQDTIEHNRIVMTYVVDSNSAVLTEANRQRYAFVLERPSGGNYIEGYGFATYTIVNFEWFRRYVFGLDSVIDTPVIRSVTTQVTKNDKPVEKEVTKEVQRRFKAISDMNELDKYIQEGKKIIIATEGNQAIQLQGNTYLVGNGGWGYYSIGLGAFDPNEINAPDKYVKYAISKNGNAYLIKSDNNISGAVYDLVYVTDNNNTYPQFAFGGSQGTDGSATKQMYLKCENGVFYIYGKENDDKTAFSGIKETLETISLGYDNDTNKERFDTSEKGIGQTTYNPDYPNRMGFKFYVDYEEVITETVTDIETEYVTELIPKQTPINITVMAAHLAIDYTVIGLDGTVIHYESKSDVDTGAVDTVITVITETNSTTEAEKYLQKANLIYMSADGTRTRYDQQGREEITKMDLPAPLASVVLNKAKRMDDNNHYAAVIVDTAAYRNKTLTESSSIILYNTVGTLLTRQRESWIVDKMDEDRIIVNAEGNTPEPESLPVQGNFVWNNIFAVNHLDDRNSSPISRNDMKHEFAPLSLVNRDFISRYYDAIWSQGFGEVVTNFRKDGGENTDAYVCNASAIQYIITFTIEHGAIYKDSIKVLEIEPVRAFRYYADGVGRQKITYKDANGVDQQSTYFQVRLANEFARKFAPQFYYDVDKIEGQIPYDILNKVQITGMTTAEFVGKLEDLSETYDVIYIGTELLARNDGAIAFDNYDDKDTQYLGANKTDTNKAYYSVANTNTGDLVAGATDTPHITFRVYNDTTMDGIVYAHTGDSYVLPGDDRDGKKLFTSYQNGDKYGGEAHTLRYSGNDITEEKKLDLLQFLNNGYPIIVADDFFLYEDADYGDILSPRSNGLKPERISAGADAYSVYVDGAEKKLAGVLDTTSEMYDLFDRVTNIYDGGFSWKEQYPNFITETDAQRNNTMETWLNTQKLSIEIFEQPTTYEAKFRSGNDENILNADDHSGYLSAGSDGNYHFNFKFRINNIKQLATDDTRYTVHLYMDTNSDGIFSTELGKTEELSGVIVTDDTSERNRVDYRDLEADKVYYLSRPVPDGFYGGVSWKLEVTQNDTRDDSAQDELIEREITKYVEKTTYEEVPNYKFEQVKAKDINKNGGKYILYGTYNKGNVFGAMKPLNSEPDEFGTMEGSYIAWEPVDLSATYTEIDESILWTLSSESGTHTYTNEYTHKILAGFYHDGSGSFRAIYNPDERGGLDAISNAMTIPKYKQVEEDHLVELQTWDVEGDHIHIGANVDKKDKKTYMAQITAGNVAWGRTEYHIGGSGWGPIDFQIYKYVETAPTLQAVTVSEPITFRHTSVVRQSDPPHTSITGVTAIIPKKEQTINILQIAPIKHMPANCGHALDLQYEMEGNPNGTWAKMMNNIPGYKLNIVTMYVDDLRTSYDTEHNGVLYSRRRVPNPSDKNKAYKDQAFIPAGDLEAVTLNGNANCRMRDFDMMIIGFTDVFDDIRLDEENVAGERALNDIVEFCKSGKSVLLSHDTTSWEYDMKTRTRYLGIDSREIFDGSLYLTAAIRDISGMDRYGYSKENEPYGYVNVSTWYDNAYAANQDKADEAAKLDGMGSIYTYSAKNSKTASDYQEYNYSKDDYNYRYQTYATQVNAGTITQYPYPIKNTISVANTHAQYYQLNLEADNDENGKADITVWYALATNPGNVNKRFEHAYDISSNNVRNNYYIYNNGNITYTGMGHELVDDSVAEIQLFVNTFVAAYRAGVHSSVPWITNATYSRDLVSDMMPYDMLTINTSSANDEVVKINPYSVQVNDNSYRLFFAAYNTSMRSISNSEILGYICYARDDDTGYDGTGESASELPGHILTFGEGEGQVKLRHIKDNSESGLKTNIIENTEPVTQSKTVSGIDYAVLESNEYYYADIPISAVAGDSNVGAIDFYVALRTFTISLTNEEKDKVYLNAAPSYTDNTISYVSGYARNKQFTGDYLKDPVKLTNHGSIPIDETKEHYTFLVVKAGTKYSNRYIILSTDRTGRGTVYIHTKDGNSDIVYEGSIARTTGNVKTVFGDYTIRNIYGRSVVVSCDTLGAVTPVLSLYGETDITVDDYCYIIPDVRTKRTFYIGLEEGKPDVTLAYYWQRGLDDQTFSIPDIKEFDGWELVSTSGPVNKDGTAATKGTGMIGLSYDENRDTFKIISTYQKGGKTYYWLEHYESDNGQCKVTLYSSEGANRLYYDDALEKVYYKKVDSSLLSVSNPFTISDTQRSVKYTYYTSAAKTDYVFKGTAASNFKSDMEASYYYYVRKPVDQEKVDQDNLIGESFDKLTLRRPQLFNLD